MEPISLSHAMQLHAQMLKTNYSHPSSSYLTNTMLRAYSTSPNPHHSLLLFIDLRLHSASLNPDNFSFPSLLAACARLRAIRQGHQLHALLYKLGFHWDYYIHNSLIHMYSSCKQLHNAALVFESMADRDVVSWTSIINGTVDADRPVEALQLFDRMLDAGIAPNDATLVSVLRACADAGAMSIGCKAHDIAEQQMLDSKANVATALIDMYAKCGRIDRAEELFGRLASKDSFAWTAMISGLASHGQAREALDLFQQMIEQGVKPDERTITAVLCACRSAGWVTEGYRHYNNMHRYGVRPRIQHYGCMVDLLARAGHLGEAEGFMRRMPIEPDAILWRSLIWASKLHGDTDRAERLMIDLQLLEKDSTNSGSYALAGNVYASTGKWKAKARVRELMLRRRIGKLPGCSKIEVNGVVHEFVAGDSDHPDAQRIYEKLEEMVEKLKLEGYEPNLPEVLLEMEDEEKALQLHHHSEKLAVAFGLIATSPTEQILVVKNLRSCKDCHTTMKLLSNIYHRDIIIRDRIKFHHFSRGSCSCKDYW